MTSPWFEEQNESYQDDTYSFLSGSVIYACINAEQKWDAQIDLAPSYNILNEFESYVAKLCSECSDPHERVDQLLDCFYQQWLFSATSLKVPEHQLNSFSYTLTMRSGSPTTLAILLAHLLNLAELEAHVTLMQGDLQVHIALSDEEGYLIEPCSGQQSWYITPENASEENGDSQEPLELVFEEELLKLYLAQQKWSFISANKFGHALSCVDMLMDLLGDDPYERRDRGYLLNQLDCPKMAKDDLQYFVDECPDDPAIELIRHQIEEIEDNNNTHH